MEAHVLHSILVYHHDDRAEAPSIRRIHTYMSCLLRPEGREEMHSGIAMFDIPKQLVRTKSMYTTI